MRSDIVDHLIGLIPISDYKSIHAIACVDMHMHGRGLLRLFRAINRIFIVDGPLTRDEHSEHHGRIHGSRVLLSIPWSFITGLIAGERNIPNDDPYYIIRVRFVYGVPVELFYPDDIDPLWHCYIRVLRPGKNYIYIHFTYWLREGQIIINVLSAEPPHARGTIGYIIHNRSWSITGLRLVDYDSSIGDFEPRF